MTRTPKTTAVCLTCGTTFAYWASHTAGKYCSLPCVVRPPGMFVDKKLASEAGKIGGKAKHPNKGFGSKKFKQGTS